MLHLALVVATLATQTPDSSCANVPVPASEQVAALRSMQDVIGVSVLADGRKAPEDVVLPRIANRLQTLDYMRVHYPNAKKRIGADVHPIAWVCVDRRGRVASAKLLNPSGDAAFDSLSLRVLSIAAFTPAMVGQDTVAIWLPLPASVPTKEDLEYAIAGVGADNSARPTQTKFTQAPELLNRSRIEAAILRVIYNVNREAAQRDERFARAQEIGGTTIMWIYIDVAGNVTNSMVKKSSGNTDLDASAQQIVASMQFLPAKLDGKVVDAWIEVPIQFRAR